MKVFSITISLILTFTIAKSQWQNLGNRAIGIGNIYNPYGGCTNGINPNFTLIKNVPYVQFTDSLNCGVPRVQYLQNNVWKDFSVVGIPSYLSYPSQQPYFQFLENYRDTLITVFLTEVGENYIEKYNGFYWEMLGNQTIGGTIANVQNYNNDLYVVAYTTTTNSFYQTVVGTTSIHKFSNGAWNAYPSPNKIYPWAGNTGYGAAIEFAVSGDTLYASGLTSADTAYVLRFANGNWQEIYKKWLYQPLLARLGIVNSVPYFLTNSVIASSSSQLVDSSQIVSDPFSINGKLGICFTNKNDSSNCYVYNGSQFSVLGNAPFGHSISAATSINNVILNNDSLYVLYSNSYGNSGNFLAELTISNSTVTEITSNDTPANFKIYPNPTTGTLNILVSDPSGLYSLQIVNSQAQSVFSTVLSGGSYQANLSGFSKGLYFIQILNTSNNILETKKLVIE
jgi:hypothetical protein